MSHVVGSVQSVTPPLVIGPDSGAPPSSPNTWAVNFEHTPAPLGTKLLMLHFSGVNFPASNRLEVDLGYDTDVFTVADGTDFWTRPVNVFAFPGNKVPIRYITNGAPNGGATLAEYGRGERHSGDRLPSALSNCDPFLTTGSYTEANYDPLWFCHTPPNWQNAACAPAGDIRQRVAASVGMVIMSDMGEYTLSGVPILSSCSVTLIGPDTVLYAGHCVGTAAMLEASGSVTFDYQTNCDGTQPAGYNPKFHKVIKVLKLHYAPSAIPPWDYCILQLRVPAAGLGLTPIPVRTDLPLPNEQVFGIHHPNGAVKKLSQPVPGFAKVIASSDSTIQVSLDVSGGSSGSGLFDSSGQITGVLSNGGACGLNYFPTKDILQDIAAAPPPSPARDVMVVFDRSGSMTQTTNTGRMKIEDARDAASLFTQLISAGAGNKLGVVSFSTTASSPVDFALAPVTPAQKNLLTGGPPFTGGAIGGLTAGGNTTIGGGLSAALAQLPFDGANRRTILLLTDGLQNTPPMIGDVEASLAGIDINAIGLGTEANLNGALLTILAEAHGGLYTRANDGLALKKYFALAFGDIFEAGSLLDPEFLLPGNQPSATPLPFSVCGEETITVVIGWDRTDSTLVFDLRTPLGAVVSGGSPGVEASSGITWSFMRVPMPVGVERDGTWTVVVAHAQGGGEFPPPPVDTRYFVNIVVRGGPRLERIRPTRRFYTGDTLKPLVTIFYRSGGFPPNTDIQLEVTHPNVSVGNVLSEARLGPGGTLDGDSVEPRQATLAAIEKQTGQPLVQYVTETFTMSDEPAVGGTGMFEGGSVFGLPFPNLLMVEGNYTFHATATYGDTCRAKRELFWSLQADVGIDPSHSDITVAVTGVDPSGNKTVQIVVILRDRYGNLVGPGRENDLPIAGNPGTTVTGPVQDNGDGSYTINGTWNSGSGSAPGVVIQQPGRTPAELSDPSVPTEDGRGSLVITFLDEAGNPPVDQADVFLAHFVLSDRREIRRWPTNKALIVRDLISTQTGIYEVQALPDRHHAVGRFVTIDDGKVTRITFKLRAK